MRLLPPNSSIIRWFVLFVVFAGSTPALVFSQIEIMDTLNLHPTVRNFVEWRDWDYKELRKKVLKGRKMRKVFGHVVNQNWEGTSYYDSKSGTDFCFKNQELIMISQINDFGLFDPDNSIIAKLIEQLGPEDISLDSFTGHLNEELVWAQYGISITKPYFKPDWLLLRIFKPMTLEEYKEVIYKDPSKFKDMMKL
jgi:hypothetical protein